MEFDFGVIDDARLWLIVGLGLLMVLITWLTGRSTLGRWPRLKASSLLDMTARLMPLPMVFVAVPLFRSLSPPAVNAALLVIVATLILFGSAAALEVISKPKPR